MSEQRADAEPGTPTKLRILIVDDIADVRRDLRRLLEIVGGSKSWVKRRTVGGDRVDRSPGPEVVVMDLAMPGLDGYAAAARITSAPTRPGLIALTVHSDGASRQKALAAGFDAYVVKGAPLQELLGAIGSLADQKPARTGGIS